MKLLIITQKIDINDPILGFFVRWVEEFAKHCERVTVICLYKGEYKLPSNVKVLSLGKEEYLRKRAGLKEGPSTDGDGKRPALGEQIFQATPTRSLRRSEATGKVRVGVVVGMFLARFQYTYRFYRHIWTERKNYDSVFVHMNPIYVILGGLFWRAWDKKIALWYTHKQVDTKLRLAKKLAHIIFTASKESFRLKSKKIHIMGHGIDTDTFSSAEKEQDDAFHIITVGRISPVKDYETLIKAAEVLTENGIKSRIDIIGGVGLQEQEKYLKDLKKMVKEKGLEGVICFRGPVPNKEIVGYLRFADLFVNTSHTGSLDKAVLEAMAVGLPALTCNEALKDVLREYGDRLLFSKKDYKELAEKISSMQRSGVREREEMSGKLRSIVVKDHDLKKLIENIINILK